MLKIFGHRVSIAHSGTDALARLAAEPFDVMLCDINMPGMQGPEVASAAVERQPALNVVLMTGFAANTHVGDRWRVLEKPIDAATLQDVLEETIQ